MTDTQVTQTRRTVLEQLGLVAGAGALAALAGRSHPVAALESDEDAFTRETVEIESFDGTTIVATYYLPVEDGPHPAILGTHGWAQERGDLDDVAAVYASSGYAGLIYDSRGHGDSEGEVTLTGEDEQQDASALIDWLAENKSDDLIMDGPDNPRLGLDGGSYGGGIQPVLAAIDDRVDAIVPRFTWFDLTEVLMPNDVLRAGWARGLIAAGRIEARLEDGFRERAERVIADGEFDESKGDIEYFRSRSGAGYPDGPNAPTLVIQEFNDRLFPADEGIDIHDWADETDNETVMLLGNGTTHNIWGDSIPGSNLFDDVAAEDAMAWFDDHLKDDGDHGLPPVRYYDESNDEFVDADAWPPSDAGTETFSQTLSAPQRLEGRDADPVTLDFPLSRELELLGAPTIDLTARPLGEGKSHLMVALKHVTDDGVRTIKDQVTPYAVTEDETLTFDLTTIQWRLDAGDILRVAFAPKAETLTEVDWPLGGGLFEATDETAGIELDGDVTLTVPARAGEEAVIPPLTAEFSRPDDPNTAGLYEDVNGDGVVDVADVQALFDNLDNPVVQDNPEAFDFSGTGGSVTIFDVQALFNRV